MPSPLAHCSLALVGWPPLARRGVRGWRRWVLLLSLLGALVAPDADIVLDPLLLGQPAFTNHGGPMHSLAAGAALGLAFALWCWLFVRDRLAQLWLVGAAACWSHALLDAATHGRGVMLLWPFTSERLALPAPLFVGVRHSSWARWDLHLLTLANELAFVVVLVSAMWAKRRLARPRAGAARRIDLVPPAGMEEPA